MQAGERAAERGAEGAWAGVVRFSGGVVADATAVCVRGVWQSVHLIADVVSRVGMSLERWREEGEVYAAGRFRLWLRQWGIAWQEVKVLVSDGAQVYAGVLVQVLRRARQQRCLFHLWRNLLPDLKTYEAEAGQEAARWVRFLLRLLWAIPTLAEAWVGLEDVERTLGEIPTLTEMFRTVRRTLPELWGTRESGVGLAERTSNVAERYYRCLRQRLRRLGCFMSERGADNFLAAWLVYANCEPYQLRRERKRVYRHPGQSPLEVGAAEKLGYNWLDLLEV
jgi:transposase-like protein